MTDNTTPRESIAAGYASSAAGYEAKKAARRVGAHHPEHDAEADRLHALGDKLPRLSRLALGYHESARKAAARNTTTTNEEN